MNLEINKSGGDDKPLQFYQLIGAPLTALVQAEAQAAQVTAEFIERVGFEPPAEAPSPPGGGAPMQQEPRRLRMLTFHYERQDKAGQRRSYQVRIPLLSLIPIPAIQIKTAEIELAANIRGLQKAKTRTQVSDTRDDFLSRERLELKMGMRGGKSASALQVKVKMNVEQADIPSGLSRLLHSLDESTLSEPMNHE
ncbi:hypothetical protein D187_005236 [Cystobacter fuscus DSM 2262]|uniref:DUF2589 domain-containing protein n=1 Tax=Cystobacter fuscus (strain ATCC 25194 / DSM 2262 / NBRC 100088 / M29) TaxID=1242864 RepID=S9R592_CYSF2|nr:DUF2589 domain-containing protein [Cystobacter fuscus]EPX64103.1 hypothetical protein D187_005236 [Cystobacter fuscus DSM 2262]